MVGFKKKVVLVAKFAHRERRRGKKVAKWQSGEVLHEVVEAKKASRHGASRHRVGDGVGASCATWWRQGVPA